MTTKPQDHKQPKDKPRRIEVMGATLTIDPSILDDLDMVEYLYDLQHAADSDDGASRSCRSCASCAATTTRT